VRGHDVVDQVAIFRLGRGIARFGVLDHLAAQLHDPASGFPVLGALEQDPGALTRDQHVEDVDDRGADVTHVFQRRRAGENGAELIDDHVLHSLDHRHFLAYGPVARERSVGDREKLMVAALDRLLGVAVAHDVAQFPVAVAVFAGQHAPGAELAQKAFPEFFRAQAILAGARAHEVGGFDAGNQDVFFAENAQATDWAESAVAVDEKFGGPFGHAEEAAQEWQPRHSRRRFQRNGVCLARRLAESGRGVLATAQAFHLAVRVRRRTSTRLCGALHLPVVVHGAESHAAHHLSVLVPHGTAARLGAENLAVLVRRALSRSAHHFSALIREAIPGMDVRAEHQQQKATGNEATHHLVSSRCETVRRRLIRVNPTGDGVIG
jgi:hypothetical protein